MPTKALAEERFEQGHESVLVNRLSDPNFQIDDNVKQKRYLISLHHELIEPEIQFKLNELFVQLCGGWSIKSTQTLDIRYGTAINWKYSLIRLGVWWSTHYPNLPLSHFSENEVKQLLADAVSNRINWRNGLEPGPINRGTIENLILALERSQDYKLKGLTTDGVTFTYPKHFLEESIKDTLKEFGVTFHDWKSGNSWESIPLPVAMTLLAEAINTIRDPKTLFLIDFFAYMRSKDSLSHRALITRGAYERNRLGRAARTTQENYERVLQLKNIVLHHYPDSEGKFPFNSQGELVEHCQNVFDQCIVIFFVSNRHSDF